LCRCRVGEGLGADLAQRFASGYKVALIARSGEVIGKVSNEIRGGGRRRASDSKRCDR
jgi:short-subunit dehydrogenase